MSKNIVILLDGTSNEIKASRTNILRLFGTLERSERQIVYYDPGVGTFGADEHWSSLARNASEVLGLATGWGLDHNVKEVYRFLVDNYDCGPVENGRHPDRDRIYLFGFSRGAYTARVLAGFIHAFGLISPLYLNLLDYAYRTYKDIPQSSPAGAGEASPFAGMRLYERMLDNDRPPIKLLGLFDTVASMIETGRGRLQFKTHPFTHSNASVEWVRHALAIDERRTMFRPELWTPGQLYRGNPFAAPKGPQNAKEVWFAGFHCDVGGGFPEKESGQIKIPLDWMIRETRPAGLLYKDDVIDKIVLGEGEKHDYVELDQRAPLHDSMNWAWRFLECIPRKVPKTSWRKRHAASGYYIPCVDPRLIPQEALIHESVGSRKSTGDYDPPNLPKTPTYVP
ncbi:Conserved hypothetical protein [Neorhizobium galegae bv. officinalis]|uniref:T6SS Phospholipase effector Tle1-like catalytic domain-containing protein n=1 Tax=Neorhizobium galegae bv. officinalis TaxID=323656 RepID=A0A0T7FWU1_NEOGA|nr:DUF2235 domain-containing protein [Neorhizobium galegae]CDZ39482.1 Conserved hypothetical protein [Neorhizobium galegae bv. officinalis]